MSFSLFPRYQFESLVDISPEFIKEQGIKFLMLDLDNTIAAYSEPEPPETVVEWVDRLRGSGVELYIISNSKRGARVEAFSKALGCGFLMRAGKPSPAGICKAMTETGFDAALSALAGDQIFTDVLAANRAGIISIIVQPVRLVNPFHTLRYYLELPFRYIR